MIDILESFGYEAASIARLRTLSAEVRTVDGMLKLELPSEVALLAHELAAAITHEFHHAPHPNRAGSTDHDRSGTDRDPAGWKQGYQHTIDTLHVHVFGLYAVVEMAGGAVFVEYHTPEHVIEAKSGDYLHFKIGNGPDSGWVRVHAVKHPDYAGDDFVGRAFADLKLTTALSRILEHVRVAQFVLGPGAGLSPLEE